MNESELLQEITVLSEEYKKIVLSYTYERNRLE